MYLVGKLMKRLVNNLFSLVIFAVAVAIPIRTSAVLVPHIAMVAATCLKLATSSSFSATHEDNVINQSQV
ncbi:hypothetical protein DPMN_110886 [Dreissena polymorpha]|uniref:Uncharacterized protein n=1 Tax=Dreissena polymorpha TaxID=45954 RepID=A0A9D4QPD0_DREPO|nr:hypothetical protein DPMN_110886 [Dreissena polymorpha]